jgi:hypothetical protein
MRVRLQTVLFSGNKRQGKDDKTSDKRKGGAGKIWFNIYYHNELRPGSWIQQHIEEIPSHGVQNTIFNNKSYSTKYEAAMFSVPMTAL